jgi:hypothetical protein
MAWLLLFAFADFFAVDGNTCWRFNTDAHDAAIDLQYLHSDSVANDDALTDASCKAEHVFLLFQASR